jgi:signal transduction histidine kinase
MRVADVLAAWRATERELAAAPDGSPARERLESTAHRLRSLHNRLFVERARELESDWDGAWRDAPSPEAAGPESTTWRAVQAVATGDTVDGVGCSPMAVPALAFIRQGTTVEGLKDRFQDAGVELRAEAAEGLLAELESLGLVHVGRAAPVSEYVLSTLGRRVVTHGSWTFASGALKELEGLRTDLLAGVSHELRTPITVIRTVAGLLLEPTAHPTAEQQHAMLQQVERNAERMERLVDDILDLARYRAGAIGLQLRPFDPIELSEAVVAMIQPLAESRHQVVELDIPRRPAPRVFGDRSRLEQALLNLVANAHHFTPEAGRIAISLKGPTYGIIEWAVKDDGPGIPEHEQARLFERFFVGRRGVSTVQDGVGLGLPTALAIAQAHGGSIAVTSRLGEGSTFTLGVPVAGPPRAA